MLDAMSCRKRVDLFAQQAKRSITAIEQMKDAVHLKNLEIELTRLYLLGLQLPEISEIELTRREPVIGDVDQRLKRSSPDFGKGDAYWFVYEPYRVKEVDVGSLHDDILDLLNDLDAGLSNYEAGCMEEALFDWKWSFETHWGKHCVCAMSAIYSLLYE